MSISSTAKKMATLSVVVASLIGASCGAYAANDANSATINFTGKVVASTCTPSWAGKNTEVDFGDVAAADFGKAVGTVAKSRDFTLSLTDCDASITAVKVTANGTPDADDAEAYKNSGEATGVGVELKTGSDVMKDGASHEFTISNSSADMNFSAQLVNTKAAAPVIGSVASTVTLNMDYE